MKKLLLISLIALVLSGCGSSDTGELVGVRKTKPFYQPDPYGMQFVPMGSFTMGVGGQDITGGNRAQSKTVSVAAFFMDETEITNNEYREFVYYVRDSIARKLLADNGFSEYEITQSKKGVQYPNPIINWDEKIKWHNDDQSYQAALEDLFIPQNERFYGRKEVDARKLNYHYSWIDLRAAARKQFDPNQSYDYTQGSFANRQQGATDRSVYIHNEVINVYPDTLSWIYDYAYAFNDPLTENYFWHEAYDNYPVVGVNWNQAKAFCVWRTNKLNKYIMSHGGRGTMAEFRLPTEAEWEWAARGGHQLNPYPWGGPYTRNDKGCLLANFKPLRGNYIADGGLTTLVVAHFPANDWGLYDMAGNVAEWTLSAYDPTSYNFTWDMNPDYQYNSITDDDPAMKRKVIRGGSWKDIAYFLQVDARAYEYQDTAKCYIGFRCLQPYLGRNKGDNPSKASRIK